ncbi:hypothetical protein DFH08DRAFT_1075387 [Mycena albidolilacea]|uniref:Uncharacterized protein n=1 Tax=Mycena albidolilacea TaxID=1033008 RepID=A0AAD7AGK2_9AGAR|nr:hypothetical protein DFH08DRAFT_1075387 [Mycena albidolilacea]
MAIQSTSGSPQAHSAAARTPCRWMYRDEGVTSQRASRRHVWAEPRALRKEGMTAFALTMTSVPPPVGRLPVASIAPTQRLRFLLFTSSPGPRVAESRSPIHTSVAPCPRSAIRSERAQDDGMAQEPRAGALAVDAPDGGRVHCPPAPVPPSASCGPAGFSILPYMRIPAMSSRARRAALLGADFAQSYTDGSCRGPETLVYPAFISTCTASDSPPIPRTPQLAPPSTNSALTASNRRPADRTTHFPSPHACPPESQSLPLKTLPLSPIFLAPQPSRQPLIPPAYVVHASERVRVRYLRGSRIGLHNRPGVDSTSSLVDIGLGILPPLPAPPSYFNLRSLLPRTAPMPQSSTPAANANATEHIHGDEARDDVRLCALPARTSTSLRPPSCELPARARLDRMRDFMCTTRYGGGAGRRWGPVVPVCTARSLLQAFPAQVSAPAAFDRGACSLTHDFRVSRPPAFSPPGSLYADRPSIQYSLSPGCPISFTPSAFPTCTSSSPEADPSSVPPPPPPVPAYLLRTSFRPVALQVWEVDSVAVLLLDFLFQRSVFSITTYIFPPVYHPVSSNASSLFLRTDSV